MRFKDQVAVVTGAARGIGRAIALAFAGEGARVALVDIDGEHLERLHEEVGKGGGQALTVPCDISKSSDVQGMVDRILKAFGRIDVLVNNAGIIRRGTIETVTEEDWDRVIAINLKGTFNYNRAAARIFREQGSGKIVNIASINGLRGKFGQSNYAASKAGIVALSKSLARELGKSQVNVNVVAPGMVRTPMTAGLPPEVRDTATREAVLGRLAEPEDVANLVTFLCSDRARHITGQVIQVDGGQYL